MLFSFDYKYHSIDPVTGEVKPKTVIDPVTGEVKPKTAVEVKPKKDSRTVEEIALQQHEERVYNERCRGLECSYNPIFYKPTVGCLWPFPTHGTTIIPKGIKRKDVPGYIEKPIFRYGE
ncbi:hypothetical protein [Candidatus Liberibacter solanacearum]|uniref:Uncharacterized protein n=1 Tax=Candidatus Liberibacter solanacearum TaxID=556287 RepID=A0A1V2N987_9HYPH|nr:hypothetical protein [Candidatus Liberibacter solanacearum]ONI60307.1 hypothetical protein AYO25_00370 [Candidatus Liberibacter solanacearum]